MPRELGYYLRILLVRWLFFMQGKIVLLFLLISTTSAAYAQNEANNWYFGNMAGLNFSTGTPVVLNSSAMYANEGCASISDKSGNLLFYTNGLVVYDKTNQFMLNGTGLNGNQTSTQSATIVPQPGNDSIYYIFTTDGLGLPNGLCYSVVNMRHNNGLGEVIIKNIQLITPTCEKLTVAKHCNNKDFWVVAHKYHSDAYYAYLLTSAGISNATNPVISNTGNVITNPPFSNDDGTMGVLKSSPDGRKIAAAHLYPYDFIELMDFDNTSGALTNPQKLSAKPAFTLSSGSGFGVYGLEFSPDSKLLYSSSTYVGSDSCVIYQFDITASPTSAIQGSRAWIFGSNHFTQPINSYQPMSMQLGPDGKIYIALSSVPLLSVINNPNVPGSGCGYNHAAIVLDNNTNPVRTCRAGLPSFPASFSYDPVAVTGSCQSQNIVYSIIGTAGVNAVKWDFGDPSSGSNNTSTSFTPAHAYGNVGRYNVQLILYRINGCGNDTVYKTIHAGPFNVSLGNDTSLCSGDSLMLTMNIAGATNKWNDGSTGISLKAKQAGKYWVTVSSGECTASDTIRIAALPLPRFSIGNDTTICSTQSLTLSPSLTYPNTSYIWNNGMNTSSIAVSNAGQYWLEVKDQYGCKSRDTVTVSIQTLPLFSLGPDTSLCQGSSLILSGNIPNAIYKWNTGDIKQTMPVMQAGTYWLEITQNNCTLRDSITITVNPLPVVSLGNDTSLCENTKLILEAANPGASYLWYDGATANQYAVTKAGSYWVKVSSRGCSSYDTINVIYNTPPVFSLGADQIICEGFAITLDPKYYNAVYLWQDGSTSGSYTATKEGLYFVTISNTCGSATDSINITKGACLIRVPGAFSPNADGFNDVFRISGAASIASFHMQIYNRFGQLVFETKDKYAGWSGSFHGVKEPSGTYIYAIVYRGQNDKADRFLKGSFVLLR